MMTFARSARGAFRCVLVLFTIGMLFSCGGSSEPSTTAVAGWVSAQEGIQAAELTFYTVAGSPVGEPQPGATTSIGSFSTTVAALPADFRVVARGGTHMGEPSSGTFTADVRGYTPQTGAIYLNPVTTMVSRYLDLHRSAGLDEATLAVKKFLQIPEWFDIGRSLTSSNRFFSTGKFLDAAMASGGIDAYIDALAARMDTPDATQAFAPDPALPRSAGSKLAMALAEGAASYVGGQAAGWALAQTGLWEEDGVTGEQVRAMQGMLMDLKHSLEDIRSDLTEIRKQIDMSTYDVRVGQMGDLESDITYLRESLLIYATSSGNPSIRDTLVDQIGSKVLSKADVIHQQQAGNAGSTPLIDLWGRIAQAQGNYRYVDSARYNPKVQAEFDYFQKLQEARLLLEVEYWHAKGEGGPDGKGGTKAHPLIDAALAKYQSNMAAQQELVRLLPEGTVMDTMPSAVDPGKRKMWLMRDKLTDPVCFPSGSWGQLCWSSVVFPWRGTRLDADSTIRGVNGRGSGGLSDWRRPKWEEVMDAFSLHGCGGSGWPQANGWPLPSDSALVLGSADFESETNVFPRGDVTHTLIRFFSVKSCSWSGSMGAGDNSDVEMEVSDADGNPGDYWNQPTVDWIPVRTVPPEEYSKYLRP